MKQFVTQATFDSLYYCHAMYICRPKTFQQMLALARHEAQYQESLADWDRMNAEGIDIQVRSIQERLSLGALLHQENLDMGQQYVHNFGVAAHNEGAGTQAGGSVDMPQPGHAAGRTSMYAKSVTGDSVVCGILTCHSKLGKVVHCGYCSVHCPHKVRCTSKGRNNAAKPLRSKPAPEPKPPSSNPKHQPKSQPEKQLLPLPQAQLQALSWPQPP